MKRNKPRRTSRSPKRQLVPHQHNTSTTVRGMMFALISGTCGALAGTFGKLLFTTNNHHQVAMMMRTLFAAGLVCSNVVMLAFFIRALRDAGSVIGTVLNSAANVVVTAIMGRVIFHEVELSHFWFMGVVSFMLGVFCLAKAEGDID